MQSYFYSATFLISVEAEGGADWRFAHDKLIKNKKAKGAGGVILHKIEKGILKKAATSCPHNN